MRGGEKIVHVHLHRPDEGLMDFYFHSVDAMCRKMTAQKIGVCARTLYNIKFYERQFYANSLCTIELITLE